MLVITRAIVSRGWQTEERQSAAIEMNRDTDLRQEAVAQKLVASMLLLLLLGCHRYGASSEHNGGTTSS